jgi:protein-S-isoprenylcysteine O-methyltransferase Ste14
MKPDDMFRYVLLAGVAALVSIGIRHRFASRTGEALDRKQEGLFILIGLRLCGLAGFAAVTVYLVKPASLDFSAVPLPIGLRWAGVVIGCITSLLLFWTLQSLGKNLTDTVVTRQHHTLVTTGPYRWVRHPFYICAGLISLTAALIAANAIFLLIGAFVMLLLALRTPIEERNLLKRFGENYRKYRERTGRYFPRFSRRELPSC